MAYELKPTVAMIACSKDKQPGKHKARDLYQGQMFKKSLRLALLKGFDYIFILSAKYRLIKLDDVIGSYDETLNDMKADDRKAWAEKVIGEMKRQIPNVEKAQLTYYAGKMYCQHLPPGRKPFSGKGVGKILQYLNKEIAKHG